MPAGLDDVSDDRFLAELLASNLLRPLVVFTTIQENMIAVRYERADFLDAWAPLPSSPVRPASSRSPRGMAKIF
jgi:hypothetical protein